MSPAGKFIERLAAFVELLPDDFIIQVESGQQFFDRDAFGASIETGHSRCRFFTPGVIFEQDEGLINSQSLSS